MAQFKPIRITSDKLNSKTKAEGQFIVTTDDGKIYLDTSSSNRVLIGSAKGTTYTEGDGISINNTKIINSGVRSIVTGKANGTIRADINGTISDVSVYGLGSAAYTDTYAGSDSAGGAATSANKVNAAITFTTNATNANESVTTFDGSMAKTISYNTIGAAASSHIHAIKDITDLQSSLNSKLNASLKGVANGVASLDNSGKIPQSQLPSYVDDVLEYKNVKDFPKEGESSKIYVATETNLTYRWGGTQYVEISPSLALGDTSETAFAGNLGTTLWNNYGTKTIGSSTKPIYINKGVPIECGVDDNGNSVALNIDISGIANSTTYLNLTNTNPSSITEYYLNWSTGGGGKQVMRTNDGFKYITSEGTTSSPGRSILTLGNSKASGIAGNKYGQVRLYGENSRYTDIIPATDASSNVTLTLPNSNGTLAKITDNVASAAKLQGVSKTSGSLSDIYNVGTGMFQYYYNVSKTVNGNMPNNSNANGLLVFNKHAGDYQSFLGFSSNGKIYYKNLTSQTDANTATWDEISFASHNHDNLYLKLTGGTLTGDLIVKNTNGQDISITLDRTNDNANWKIINTGGVLKFQNDYTTGKGNYFDVFTLKYNRDGALLACQLNVGGALTAEGATALNNTLNVAGATTLNSTLSVARATTLNSTLSVAGATTLNSTLSVTETTTFVDRTTHNGKITVKSSSGSYINGKTTANASIQISTKQTSDYSPVLGITTSSDHVFNLGGISNTVGFYGYLASRTANGTDWSFVVDTTTGNWTCNKKITASGGFEGTLTGNASTATALTSSAGSSTLPIYFKSGKPVAIDKTGVDISITGSADRLQGLEKTSGSLADIYNINDGGFKYYYSINKTVTGNMPTPPNNANSMLVLSRSSGNYKSFIGFSSDGLIYYKDVTSAASAANGAWSTVAFTSSNVASASKLSSGTVGSNTLPVYFNNGVPTAINTTNVGISINGSAAKIVATNSNATGGSEYNLLWLSGTTAQEPKINDGMRYYSQQGTTSATGQSIAILGNATASGTSGNKSGKVRLYGTNTYYTDLAPGTTSSNITLTLPTDSGTLARTTDNVLSATKLQTAKTFTIGSSSKTFDGRNNVSWSLTEIGAAASSHTHSYLPLSGGTLTGTLTANAPIVVNKYLNLPFVNGSYLTGMDNTQVKISTAGTGMAGYCPLIGVKTQNSHYFNLGGKGDQYGFFSFKSGRTTDNYDARFVLDASTNKFYLKGNMEMEGFFKISNEIQCTSQAAYRSVNGNYGAYWFNNGSDFYLVMTDSGNQYGGFNSYRPFYVNFSTGIASLNGAPGGVNCGTSATPTGNPGTIYIQY